jgi:hypothetical protein
VVGSSSGGGGGGFDGRSRGGGGESSSIKREGGSGPATYETRIKIEDSLLIEDVKNEDAPAYIKLKVEQKDSGNEYRQSDASDRLAELLEAKVLNDIFNTEISIYFLI